MSATLVRLPSLDLIRGFVAVGRRMSITLAAQDLCLTQSAVSRQIQALEDSLGLKLLVRGHRAISFTPEGERLFRSADGAVQQLQEVVGALKAPLGRRQVTITASVGVAGLWLIPRLGRFLTEHPELDVRVSATTRVVDLKAEGVDLAIRYGAAQDVPEGSVRLFGESVAPVAHPALGLQSLDDPAQLAAHVLLEFDGPYRPWLQWSEWLASRGWSKARPQGVLRFNQYDQIIQAALAGQGIALGRLPLLEAQLAEGRLVILGESGPAPSPGLAYWLVSAEAQPPAAVAAVRDWLQREATGNP